MKKSDKEILLEEYSQCELNIEQNDNAIWTTATTFFTISAAGIAYVSSQKIHNVDSFIFVSLVAIASIGILIGWFLAFLRWRSYQHLIYYRMREIEEELSMYMIRYAYYLNNIDKLKNEWENAEKTDHMKFINVRKSFSKNWFTFRRSSSFKFIIFILILCWIIVILREAYLAF